ncbi:DNA-binding IclR family transcriptional regulator [Nonomuraea thailandensis]|uniref:DNA-binding IclR family transcriptional regulator n=1 Tax=Nonomuraea thailandensis TaxID=1188745 RepID=A0A9X2G9P5_9ACTN|nr:IclR family transcriptional regulator [Nonomuraea thailandensis]MCP2353645.1 DNA-binding IclR family transcriptional regulator [Nonomuraea thailandensis]
MHPRSGEGTLPERIAAILSAFTPGDNLLGVTEIARRTNLPPSTVHRLAADLVSCGLLERHGTGVRLGLRLFELGQRVPRRRVLREAALPYMADLREATGHTVHLAVLEGREVVYLEILEAPGGPNLPSAVGGRLPAAATGVGKAILAFSPADVLDTVLAAGLPRLTAHTLTMPGLLSRQLETVRDHGVAYDREESRIGVLCAAAPILNEDSIAIAAISASGWSTRMRLDHVTSAVRTAALGLSRVVGRAA